MCMHINDFKGSMMLTFNTQKTLLVKYLNLISLSLHFRSHFRRTRDEIFTTNTTSLASLTKIDRSYVDD